MGKKVQGQRWECEHQRRAGSEVISRIEGITIGELTLPYFVCGKLLLRAAAHFRRRRLIADCDCVLLAAKADFGQRSAAVTVVLEHSGIGASGLVEVYKARRSGGDHFAALENV